MNKIKLFADVDTGIDDALALIYLEMMRRAGSLELLGCSTVAGNVDLKQTTRNTLKMWEWLKFPVPVAEGSEKPLLTTLNPASFIHGHDGLGNSWLSKPKSQVIDESVTDLLIRLSHEQQGELTLLTTAPLTNIALAMLHDPKLAYRIKSIIMMGGAFADGNVSAVAEANFSNDPEAARIVLKSGVPITMIGLDITHQVYLEEKDLKEINALNNERSRYMMKIIHYISDAYDRLSGSRRCVLHDPLAAGVALDPSLVRTELHHVDIELHGELTRGMSVVDRRGRIPIGKPNVHVALEVEARRFKKTFLESLLKWGREG